MYESTEGLLPKSMEGKEVDAQGESKQPELKQHTEADPDPNKDGEGEVNQLELEGLKIADAGEGEPTESKQPESEEHKKQIAIKTNTENQSTSSWRTKILQILVKGDRQDLSNQSRRSTSQLELKERLLVTKARSTNITIKHITIKHLTKHITTSISLTPWRSSRTSRKS
jgi:hypothetical protein